MESLKAGGGGAEIMVDVSIARVVNGEDTGVDHGIGSRGSIRGSNRPVRKVGEGVGESRPRWRDHDEGGRAEP